jgi:hypothetical protein
MHESAFSGFAELRARNAVLSLFGFLVALAAIAFLFTGPIVHSQGKSPAVLPAPSTGKAIVCVYRQGRFVGSSAHDELYVNDTHVGKLLNGEYTFAEVPAGTVVISGLLKMYYGSAVMSAGAALNQARQKENERARFEAEAGKTYYFKWTSGPMATAIKVTAVDNDTGAKEMSKLHITAPPWAKIKASQRPKRLKSPGQSRFREAEQRPAACVICCRAVFEVTA